MSSSCWLLEVESRDFQAEKERSACKAEQIHKMTTIFTKNGPSLSFCEFTQLCKQIFLSQLENHVTQLLTANPPIYLRWDFRNF